MKITMSALSSVRIPENYGPEDKTRDFRRVFLGSSEGVRVLHELFQMTGFHHVALVGGQDTCPEEKLAFFEGRRSVFGEVMMAIEREPLEIEVVSERKHGGE